MNTDFYTGREEAEKWRQKYLTETARILTTDEHGFLQGNGEGRTQPQDLTTDKDFSKGDPFPFKLGMFEVKNQSHSQFSNAQIIDHLAPLMVGDVLNHFCVHDHLLKGSGMNNPRGRVL